MNKQNPKLKPLSPPLTGSSIDRAWTPGKMGTVCSQRKHHRKLTTHCFRVASSFVLMNMCSKA